MRSVLLTLICVGSFLGMISGQARSSEGVRCQATALRYNEAVVCNDPGTSMLYRDMRSAYELVGPAANALDPGVSKRQAEWEYMLLTQCGNMNCLRAGLQARISQLQQALINVNKIREARGEPPVPSVQTLTSDRQRAPANPAEKVTSEFSRSDERAVPETNALPQRYGYQAPGADANPNRRTQSGSPYTELPKSSALNHQSMPSPTAALSTTASANKTQNPGLAAVSDRSLSTSVQAESIPKIQQMPEAPPGAMAAVSDIALAPREPKAESIVKPTTATTAGLSMAMQPEDATESLSKTKVAPLSTSSPSEASTDGATQGYWDRTKAFLKTSLKYLLIINTIAMILVSCATPFKLFTNHTDVLYVIGTAVIALFSGALSGDIIGIAITLGCLGVVALHTFRTIPFAALAMAMLCAKFYLLVFAGMYIIVLVLIACLIGAFFAQRKQSTVNTVASIVTSGAAGYFLTKLLTRLTHRLVLDPVMVPFETYRLGITSSRNKYRVQRPSPSEDEK